MKLRYLLFFLMGSICIPKLYSQGPVSPTGLIGQKELVLIWDEGEGGSESPVYHQVAKLKPAYEAFNANDRFIIKNKAEESDGSYGSRSISAVEGDFTGNGKHEYVTATYGSGNMIDIVLPEINDELTYTEASRISIDASLSSIAMIRLASGDFDGDGDSEILVAYRNSTDNKIYLQVIDTDGTTQLNERAVVGDEELHIGTSNLESFDITTADLNGNGSDEIVLVFRSTIPEQGLYIKIYEVTGEGSTTITSKGRILVDNSLPLNGQVTVAVTAGDYNNDGKTEIAVGYGISNPCEGGCDDTFVYPIQVGVNETGDPLEDLTLDAANRYSEELSVNELSPLRLVSGDLNGNGKDDIVMACANNQILVAETGLGLSRKTWLNGSYYDEFGFSFDFAKVTDITGNHMPELVIADHFFSFEPSGDQYFTISVYEFDENHTSTLIARVQNHENISNGSGGVSRRRYAMAAGDFDGDNFKIGEGTKYVKTAIVQPLVILNAPPTHFDILGDQVFDLNSCYNENIANCAHHATYSTSTQETKIVNTEITTDWGVSSTLSAGGTFLGAGVKAHMTASYGEKFSKTIGSSSTINIKAEIVASGDDLIYATVCDYEIWEYPVYTANNTLAGHVLAVIPLINENRWFPSKGRSADEYKPAHEVGNILSYSPYNDFNNPFSETLLRGSYIGDDSYDLHESSNYTFSVGFGNTFSESSTRQKDIGLEVGATVSKWGISASVTGTYDRSEINTHSTTVDEEINIQVKLGAIDRSLGETNFNVTPYVYWAENGALVVDYAARAILPGGGSTATWWSDKYGDLPDPAFILPWRYDPEKGLAIQDEARRQETKSITFSPLEPAVGDTVTIMANVHNFSLKNTAEEVQVKFYVGDPNNGGTLITGINGETVVSTSQLLPAQGHEEVQIQWVMPSGLPTFPRIYAVIDPDNLIEEIHSNNNIGWTVLGKQQEPVSIDDTPILSGVDHVNLTKHYPNPFTNGITIEYNVPVSGKTSLVVYDIQGREVNSIFDEHRSAGHYSTNLKMDDFADGIYFYRFSTGGIMVTERIVKIK